MSVSQPEPRPTDAGQDAVAAPSGSRAVTALAGLVALQALALAGLAVFLLVETLADAADSVGRGLAMAAFALVVAALVGVVSRGMLRRERWSRAPTAVLQLLALPVAVSLLQSEQTFLGVVLGAWALAALALLVSSPVVRETTQD